jgi:hypothetical protein
MSLRAGRACLLLAVTLAAAGCGSATAPTSSRATHVPAQPLATSLTTGSGTWAVAVMGGSAASYNNFWQLFVRPAGTARWRLVTPPGVASNGGLVVTGLRTGPVVAGFRPSQGLAYSPLASTHDDGSAWTPGVLDAGLADVPDALATAPATGHLLALLTNGEAEVAGPGATAWTRLTTHRALAASAAGRRCGLGSLAAAAFGPSGIPMLAASCTRPGIAGIFAYTNGTWRPAGPTLADSYAHQKVAVLRLAATGSDTTALLTAGSGPAARLLTARSADSGAHWVVSPALPLGGARLTSASFGTGGTVALTLTGNRAEALTAGGSWRQLPSLPAGTATLAPGPGAEWDALAVHSTRLTVWQLAPGARAWASVQTLIVPIQFGSSS